MTEVAYRHLTGAEALAALPELCGVYDAVFSLPPYDEDEAARQRFPEWLTDEVNKPGFDMLVAQVDDAIVGFAYGYTMAAGSWWQRTGYPAPEDLKAVDKFAVIEWAVLPERRGAGTGRKLLDDLLAGRPESLATLTVNPLAEAKDVYLRWGWRYVLTTVPRRLPGMDILVRDLPQAMSHPSG